MTERKKQFVADALSEITDDFVAEAVEYQKPKPVWRYTKELVTVAACIAVMFVSVNVIRLIPIGGMETTTNEAAPEAVFDQTTMQVEEENITTGAEDLNGQMKETAEKEKLYSTGIEWSEVTQTNKQSNQDMCGYPTAESMVSSSITEWVPAEEILASDIEIFMGTVLEIQTYHVTGGIEKYFTVATVEVEDSIRSEMAIGDTCRIYLPFAEVDGVTTTTFLVGDLDELKIGSRAIFMPRPATKDAGEGKGDVWLGYGDFSDYYFSEGMRYLFLETETGTSYATSVYEAEGGRTAGLEEIAAYLRDMLEK